MMDGPTPSGDTTAGGRRRRTTASQSDAVRLTEFATFQEGYVRHYIALADGKAVAFISLVGAFLGYLFSKPAFCKFLAAPACEWSNVFAWISAVLLMAAAMCLVLVIAPRIGATHDGLVFYGSVVGQQTAQAYVTAIRTADTDQIADERLRHCYDVSAVCWRKYRILRAAIWLAAAGFISALPLMSKITS